MTKPDDAMASPETGWGRVRWTVALASVALLGFVALVAHGGAWKSLGVDHADNLPYFLDLVAILAAGQMWMAGMDVYQAPNPFDPIGRPLGYPPGWLITGEMGLTTRDAMWLGGLLALVFFAVAAWVLAPRGRAALVVALTLLVSPPILLGVERGNNDLVVFILLAVVGGLLARRGWAMGALSGSILAVVALLKIYPLITLPTLAAWPVARRRVVMTAAAALVVCALGVWMSLADYERVLGYVTPNGATLYGYGARMQIWSWQPHASAVACQWVATVITVVVAAGFLRRQTGVLWRMVPAPGAEAAWFVAGGLAWTFCWVTNVNFPYRAVLLLLPARHWLALAFPAVKASPVAEGQRTARVLLGLSLAAFWLLPAKLGAMDAINALGPPAWTGMASTGEEIRLSVALGVEQILIAAVSVALSVSLAGWAWNVWRQDSKVAAEL